MEQVPAEVSATERARWLTELAAAVEEAQKVAWQVGQSGSKAAEAMELYFRLETVRLEVETMRTARSDRSRAEFNPKWSESSPWSMPEASSTS